jgi:hypothetical protein
MFLIEESLRHPLHIDRRHLLDALGQFVQREEAAEVHLLPARFDMRLEVDSRLSISEPLR